MMHSDFNEDYGYDDTPEAFKAALEPVGSITVKDMVIVLLLWLGVVAIAFGIVFGAAAILAWLLS